MELGPLAEKYATRGDAHFPTTVFGLPSFAVGDLRQEVNKVNYIHVYDCVLSSHPPHIPLPCSSDVGKYLCSYFIIYSDARD